MTGEYFTFDNGTDRRRVDYDQFLLNLSELEETPENAELWKLFSLFDTDGSRKIDTEGEANELFGFIKEKAGNGGILEEEELRDWIASCADIEAGKRDNIFTAVTNLMEQSKDNTKVTYDDNNRVIKEEYTNGNYRTYIYHDDENPPCVEIVMNNGNKYFVSELNEDGSFNENSKIYKRIEDGFERKYTYKKGYVEIQEFGSVYKVNTVNNYGDFTDDDFISETYTDKSGRKVIIEKTTVQTDIGEMELISKRIKLSRDEELTTIYWTESYYNYDLINLGHRVAEVKQTYKKGENEEYSVEYVGNNTITHAAYEDTVEKLVTKFGFRDSEDFYRLNPDLREKEIIAGTEITVPGHLAANSAKITAQGTVSGEVEKLRNDIIDGLNNIREQYFPDMDEALFFALQEVEGFELSQNNGLLYTNIATFSKDKQTIILNCIQNRAETAGAEQIKNVLLKKYGIDLNNLCTFGTIDTTNLSPQQMQLAVASTMKSNVQNAYIAYNCNTNDTGWITDFVRNWQDTFYSTATETETGRKLLKLELTAELLELAAKGELTKRIYYDKVMAFKRDVEHLSATKLEEKGLKLRQDMHVEGNEEAWNELIPFERVFKIRTGFDYNPNDMKMYLEKEANLTFLGGVFAEKSRLEGILTNAKNLTVPIEIAKSDRQYISDAGNSDPYDRHGTRLNLNQSAQDVVAVLFDLYGDREQALKVLKDLGYTNLDIVQDKNGKWTLRNLAQQQQNTNNNEPFDLASSYKTPYLSFSDELMFTSEGVSGFVLNDLADKLINKIDINYRTTLISVGSGVPPELVRVLSSNQKADCRKKLNDAYNFMHTPGVSYKTDPTHKRMLDGALLGILHKFYGYNIGNMNKLLETFGFSDLRVEIETDGHNGENFLFSRSLEPSEWDKLCNSLEKLFTVSYDQDNLQYFINETSSAYQKLVGLKNDAEVAVGNYTNRLQKGTNNLYNGIATAGAVIIFAEEFIPIAGQAAAAITIAGYSLLLGGNITLMTIDAVTQKGGATKENWQAIGRTFLGNVETAAMIYCTGKIGKGFSALGDKAIARIWPELLTRANTQMLAKGTTSLGIKALNYGRGILNSGLTFGTWGSAMGGFHYVIGMSDEDSLLNALGNGFWHDFKFGVFMGATSPIIRYTSNTMIRTAYGKRYPKMAEANATAAQESRNALKGQENLKGAQVTEQYQKAYTKASMPKGAKLAEESLTFLFEIGTFTGYDVICAMNSGEIPADMSLGEYFLETLKGQTTNLLKIKSMGYLISSHKLNKRNVQDIFPQKIPEGQDIEITQVEKNGRTEWTVKYPGGKTTTTRNWNDVIAMSNAHRQQVLVFDPLEKLLNEENGTLDIGDGMRLVKNNNGYGIIFNYGKPNAVRVSGETLPEVFTKANQTYTRDLNETRLRNKGRVTIGDYEYSINEENEVTAQVGDKKIEADDLSTAIREVAIAEECASLTKKLAKNNTVAITEGTFVQKTENGGIRLSYVTPYGEHVVSDFRTLDDAVRHLYSPTLLSKGSTIQAIETKTVKKKITVEDNEGQETEIDAEITQFRNGVEVTYTRNGIDYKEIYDSENKLIARVVIKDGKIITANTIFEGKSLHELKYKLQEANNNWDIPLRDAIIAELNRNGYTTEFKVEDFRVDDRTTILNEDITVSYNSEIPENTGNQNFDNTLNLIRWMYENGNGDYVLQTVEENGAVTTKMLNRRTGRVINEIIEYKDSNTQGAETEGNSQRRVEIIEHDYDQYGGEFRTVKYKSDGTMEETIHYYYFPADISGSYYGEVEGSEHVPNTSRPARQQNNMWIDPTADVSGAGYYEPGYINFSEPYQQRVSHEIKPMNIPASITIAGELKPEERALAEVIARSLADENNPLTISFEYVSEDENGRRIQNPERNVAHMTNRGLVINRYFLDNIDNVVNAKIEDFIAAGTVSADPNGQYHISSYLMNERTRAIQDKLNNYANLSLAEKFEFCSGDLMYIKNLTHQITKYPDIALEVILKNEGNANLLRSMNRYKTFDEVSQMSSQDQLNYLKEITGFGIKIPSDIVLENYPGIVLIHEMGHQAHHQATTPDQMAELTDIYTSIMFSLPDPQRTASKVSARACEGPKEFVAEVYAGLKHGQKFSEDVMNLYRQYHGPEVESGIDQQASEVRPTENTDVKPADKPVADPIPAGTEVKEPSTNTSTTGHPQKTEVNVHESKATDVKASEPNAPDATSVQNTNTGETSFGGSEFALFDFDFPTPLVKSREVRIKELKEKYPEMDIDKYASLKIDDRFIFESTDLSELFEAMAKYPNIAPDMFINIKDSNNNSVFNSIEIISLIENFGQYQNANLVEKSYNQLIELLNIKDNNGQTRINAQAIPRLFKNYSSEQIDMFIELAKIKTNTNEFRYGDPEDMLDKGPEYCQNLIKLGNTEILKSCNNADLIRLSEIYKNQVDSFIHLATKNPSYNIFEMSSLVNLYEKYPEWTEKITSLKNIDGTDRFNEVDCNNLIKFFVECQDANIGKRYIDDSYQKMLQLSDLKYSGDDIVKLLNADYRWEGALTDKIIANNLSGKSIELLLRIPELTDAELARYLKNSDNSDRLYISENDMVDEIYSLIRDINGNIKRARKLDKVLSEFLSNSENIEECKEVIKKYLQDNLRDLGDLDTILTSDGVFDKYQKAYKYLETNGFLDSKIIFVESINDIPTKFDNVAVFDGEGNFIKRVVRSKSNNTNTEIIYTDKNIIEYHYTKSKDKLSESVKKVYDKDKKLLYTERTVRMKDFTDKFNIIREYPDGRSEQIATIQKTENGKLIETKHFIHDNGSVTNYEYTENPDASRSVHIEMKDDKGNVTLHHDFEYKVIDENHFKTIENGIEYDIQYTENEVVVTRSDGEQVRIPIGDNALGTDGVLSRDLLPIIKQMPGSFYLNIDKYNLNKIGLGINNIISADARYFSDKNIIAIGNDFNDNFDLSHEYNHFIVQHLIKDNFEQIYQKEEAEYKKKHWGNNYSIVLVIQKTLQTLYLPEENPNAESDYKFLKENFPETYEAIARSINSTLMDTYVKERQNFLHNATNFETNEMEYLITRDSYQKTDFLCSLEEMTSDIRALMYATPNEILLNRTTLLQKYFPETFKMIANMVIGNKPYRTVEIKSEKGSEKNNFEKTSYNGYSSSINHSKPETQKTEVNVPDQPSYGNQPVVNTPTTDQVDINPVSEHVENKRAQHQSSSAEVIPEVPAVEGTRTSAVNNVVSAAPAVSAVEGTHKTAIEPALYITEKGGMLTLDETLSVLKEKGVDENAITSFSRIFKFNNIDNLPKELSDFIMVLKEKGISDSNCVFLAQNIFVFRPHNGHNVELIEHEPGELNKIIDCILELKAQNIEDITIFRTLDRIKNEDGSINNNLLDKTSFKTLANLYEKYKDKVDASLIRICLTDNTGHLNSENINAIEYVLENCPNIRFVLRWAKNKDGIIDFNTAKELVTYTKENSTDPYALDIRDDLGWLLNQDGKFTLENKPILDNAKAELKNAGLSENCLEYLMDNNGRLDFNTLQEKVNTIISLNNILKEHYKRIGSLYERMGTATNEEKYETLKIILNWLNLIENPGDQRLLLDGIYDSANPYQIMAIDEVAKRTESVKINELFNKFVYNDLFSGINAQNKNSVVENYIRDCESNTKGWGQITYTDHNGNEVSRFNDTQLSELSSVEPNNNIIDFAKITYRNSRGELVPRFSVADLKKFADIEITPELIELAQKTEYYFTTNKNDPILSADALVKIAKNGTAGNFIKLMDLQIERNGKLVRKYNESDLEELADVKISDNLLKLAELNYDGRRRFNASRLVSYSKYEITDNMVEWAKIILPECKYSNQSENKIPITDLYNLRDLDKFEINDKVIELMSLYRYNPYTTGNLYNRIELETIERALASNNIDDLIRWANMTVINRNGEEVPRFNVSELDNLAETKMTDNVIEWANMTYTDKDGTIHSRFNGYDLAKLADVAITENLKKWANCEYKTQHDLSFKREFSVDEIILLKDIEMTENLTRLATIGDYIGFTFSAENLKSLALAEEADLLAELYELKDPATLGDAWGPKSIFDSWNLKHIFETGSIKGMYKLATATKVNSNGNVVPCYTRAALNSIADIRITVELAELALKNSMIVNDIRIASDFVEFQGINSIDELSRSQRKQLLKKIMNHNSDLFAYGYKIKEIIPLVPNNKNEYCSIMNDIANSIKIRTSAVNQNQIYKFNNDINNLANTLAQIEDANFASMHIEQEFSRNDFVQTVLEKTAHLSAEERQKVFGYFGFDINTTNSVMSGYPFDNDENVATFHITDTKTINAINSIRQDIVRFSTNNKIKCNNNTVELLLNEIAEVIPEIHTIVGKEQHGAHDFDVLQHSLKVMQKITQDPNYQNLNESDKKVMLYAALLHDVAKAERQADKTHAKEGSFDAFYITRKLNLTRDEQIKLCTLIENHEWLEYVNTATNEVELTQRLQSVAFDLQNDNLLDLALMFTHADLRAVKADDLFHDTNDDSTRAIFDLDLKRRLFYTGHGAQRVSHGTAANIYAARIREYTQQLQYTKPWTPVTPVPDAQTILSRITQINPDGSTNFKGVFVDKDGLIVIKFNDVEDWEALGFPKGTTTKGIHGIGTLRGSNHPTQEFETGNFKIFAHGLDYKEQLSKFDIFNMPDSDALISVTYMERPETKYRNFRAQGIGLNVHEKYVHGGGETDAGSGCGKTVDDFKANYIFGGYREGDRVFTANVIKRATGMSDEQFVEFYRKNENKTWPEAEPIDGSDPVEFRNMLIKALAESIVSTERDQNRAYTEYYISNPEEPMFTWVYAADPNEIIGENPLEFLNRTSLTDGETQTRFIGHTTIEPVAKRTAFLREYSIERNKVMFVFGN